jgi:glyoxylase-like metal-dependent hydrolase (beta-lactamase superfamily II)
MKLRQITPGAYYLPSATNLGVVATPDSGAVLIDTGQDADQARRLLKACEAIGLTPRAIINTHAHADHFGGNEYLSRKTSAPICAPPFEEAFITYPYLEPFYLFSGAHPIRPLQTTW